jgi:ribosome-binding ATPase YchF (GTP1/OBG family)
MRLFAAKPRVAVFNVAEDRLGAADEEPRLASPAGRSVVLCAPVEQEIAQLGEDERGEFLAGYGLETPASERLTRVAYEALDLISFFTVGADEVRAWPIARGSDAVTAAGKIHTDLARGFIRAEVVPYALVEESRDEREYKAAGHHELKGKDYMVQDGDILNIRFSV